MSLWANISADSTFTDEEVQIFPSLAIAFSRSKTVQSDDIVFLSFSSMIRWLGILHDDEAHTYLFPVNHKKSNTQYAWMLGGVCWSFSHLYVPLHLFPGLCCKSQSVPSEEPTLSSSTMTTIKFDDMTNMFQHTFKQTPTPTGISHLEMDEGQLHDLGLSRVSWTSLQQRRLPHRTHYSYVLLGRLHVVLPSFIVTDVNMVRPYNQRHLWLMTGKRF